MLFESKLGVFCFLYMLVIFKKKDSGLVCAPLKVYTAQLILRSEVGTREAIVTSAFLFKY